MQPWYSLNKKEFLQYISSENHAFPLKRYRFSEGRKKDTEAIEIHTGTGLSFTILPDRCCDIARTSYKGVPLAWISNAGPAAPSYYNSSGLHWRDTFCGGLLTTCGLDTAGPPSCDEGTEYGLHGCVGHIPAEEICHWGQWEGDTYSMHVTGKIHHAFPLAGHLLLERHIWAEMGKNDIHIEDRVTNLGARPSPVMILYHMNFGYPLLCPETKFYADAASVDGTSDLARERMETAYVFQKPEPDYSPRAYIHRMNSRQGTARASLCNEKLGLGVTAAFDAGALPYMSLWKHLCSGNYLTSLEPMNAPSVGRAENRKRGTLPVLQAGESQNYTVTVTVHDGEDQLKNVKESYEFYKSL